jgi:DNA replication and repair protein RecF
VAGRFSGAWGDFEIGTGTPPDGPADKRVFRLDGAPARNQAELAERVAAVWLTPQMDRLFQEGASGRRRFLDRLAWALDPGHAREVAAYDNAMAQRNRLLSQGGDATWLAGLEDAMARHGVAATAARRALVARLDAVLAAGALGGFPAASLTLRDATADALDAGPALAAEDGLRAALRGGKGQAVQGLALRRHASERQHGGCNVHVRGGVRLRAVAGHAGPFRIKGQADVRVVRHVIRENFPESDAHCVHVSELRAPDRLLKRTT